MQEQAHILVADDERNIRTNLAALLESAGYVVDVARDGEEALDICKQRRPDIAFVDLHMPKLPGLEVLAQIRALSPKTAVVIITAYGSAASAVEAMKLGAVDFLEKPFEPKIIGILAEEILFRRAMQPGASFDDLMHLADLARERNAVLEARGYLKAAMTRALDRPQAIRYYYMAVTARSDYAPAVEALKRSGKLH